MKIGGLHHLVAVQHEYAARLDCNSRETGSSNQFHGSGADDRHVNPPFLTRL